MRRKLKWLAIGTVVVATMGAPAATWNGAGEDDNWSNGQNWVGGTPPGGEDRTAGIGTVDTRGIIHIDAPPDVSWINFFAGVATDFTINGPETLLLTLDGTSRSAVNNASGATHTFNANVRIQDAHDWRIVRSNSGGGFVFNGDLAATDALLELDGDITINRRLVSSSGVRVVAGSAIEFNNTLDNDISAFTVAGAGARVVVNTPDGVTFYNGLTLQVNQNTEFEFHGANVLGDSTRLVIGNAVTDAKFSFHADEELGFLRVVGSGLEIGLGEDVATLVFGDSSAQTWNDDVVISGFRSGVIRFGDDETGLTEAQLNQLKAFDPSGMDVSDQIEMDTEGYLIIAGGTPAVITGVQHMGANEFHLFFTGGVGEEYVLEETLSLLEPWEETDISMVALEGTNTIQRIQLAPAAFWRLKNIF